MLKNKKLIYFIVWLKYSKIKAKVKNHKSMMTNKEISS